MRSGVVLSHPGCGPFVQQAARALHQAGLLNVYVTTFRYDRDTALARLLRLFLRVSHSNPDAQLARRAITEVPPDLVKSYPAPEFIRMLAANLGPIIGDRVWEPTEKWFDRIVARHHVPGSAAIYGYEHACFRSFLAAKRQGALCIYDMPICHHATTARWLEPEFQKFPELITPYEAHRKRLASRRNRRKDAELALADRIIVASKFVLESLAAAGVPREKIWVIPSGAPAVDTSGRSPDPSRFVILIAGHLSVRKGTHYALAAWRKLIPPKGVELWLVGDWQLPNSFRKDLPGTVLIRDTVPRDELYAMFDRANVLVLPTLAEGLALTPLQAMSRGLPVITTPNSGADVFIRHGENGLLIPPADETALASELAWCICHPDELRTMGLRAAEKMAAWQWSDYRAALGKTVRQFLTEAPVEERIAACAGN